MGFANQTLGSCDGVFNNYFPGDCQQLAGEQYNIPLVGRQMVVDCL